MTIFPRSAALAAAGAALLAPASANAVALHHEHVLGVSLDVAIVAQPAEADAAGAAAIEEIARLDQVLSGWRADSELAALNRARRFSASPDLFEVIAFGERMRRETKSAFTPRLGAVTLAWRHGLDDLAIKRLAADAETADVALDSATRMIWRPASVQFDLDGYAKGYVIDLALAAMRAAAPAARGFLLNLGGDVGAWGVGPDGLAWPIGIGGGHDNMPPADVVRIGAGGVAVSAGGARDFLRGGRAYSHFIAADDGRAQALHRGVAVHARSAMEADALATALMLTPLGETGRLAARFAEAAARIEGFRVIETPTWSALRDEAVLQLSCQAGPPTGAPWPAGFRAEISFEIPRIEAANYERPYLAVWISDQNRRLVRTLLILGDEARWRESNYVFWRRIERFDLPGVQAMARNSRAPGRYDLVWDGADNAGLRVPQGVYTLHIEASREHGAHSIQSVPLTLAAAPFDTSAEARGEVGAVRVRYGRAR